MKAGQTTSAKERVSNIRDSEELRVLSGLALKATRASYFS